GEAEIEAPGIFATLTRPKGKTVAELWNAYLADYAGRAIVENMPFTWKALGRHFGAMDAEQITIEDCRAYTEKRRRAGISDGTTWTELGRLRMVLKRSKKRNLIAVAPDIERPAAPKPPERHLTRDQCRAIIEAANLPHSRYYLVLLLATGA